MTDQTTDWSTLDGKGVGGDGVIGVDISAMCWGVGCMSEIMSSSSLPVFRSFPGPPTRSLRPLLAPSAFLTPPITWYCAHISYSLLNEPPCPTRMPPSLSSLSSSVWLAFWACTQPHTTRWRLIRDYLVFSVSLSACSTAVHSDQDQFACS